MRTSILFLILLTNTAIFGQSREITGTVKAKSDDFPLPGATVKIKGTDIGTQTDFDGHFKITVPDSLKTLSFSYIGFKNKNFPLNDKQHIEVLIKEDCTLCFFDYRDFSISYFGGLKNASNGFMLDMTIPTPLRLDGPLQLKYGYQTNFKENKQHYFEAGIPHFFADCGFIADLRFKHTDIENGPLAFDYKDYRIEGAAEFRLFKEDYGKIYFGYGISQIKKPNVIQKHKGYELGIGKYLRHGIEAHIKTTYWSSFWQHQVGLDWGYRRFKVFFQYNKIAAYNEYNLGIGIKLY